MKRALMALYVLALFSISLGMPMSRQEAAAGSEGQFDYYVLALSWAPNYCGGHPKDHSNECRLGARADFVLHGLWPQNNSGSPPLGCAAARPVSHATVRHMLEYFPSKGLIQHEWRQHGVCSGLSAADYFAKVEQAFNSIRVPEVYRNLDHDQTVAAKDVERSFAQANHAPPEAFRVSCRNGDLINVEVCLTKDLQYRACTASVRECRAPQVMMRATQ